jgi:Flp pilus assembly protein TadG
MKQPLRRTVAESSGQAIIEFALLLPLFLLLLFGMVDFGRVYSALVTQTNAAREGARLGVTGATQAAIITRSQSTSANSCNNGNPAVAVQGAKGASGTDVVVTVSCNLKLITPLAGMIKLVTGGAFPGTIPLSSSADMRIE